MSELYVTENGDIIYGAESPQRAASSWRPLALKTLLAVLVLFLMAEIVYYVLVIPATSIPQITVEGTTAVGADELCSMAGITGSETWANFSAPAVAVRLAANPLFEKVRVEKRFPDRVLITVTERTAVAVAFTVVNGRTLPMEIDRTGIAFRIGGQINSSLPVLTGLTIDKPIPGMRLHAQLRSLLEDLSTVEKTNPVLLASVSEIKIEQKTYGGYDLVVYPVHTPIRVRTDKALNQEALQYMMLVLDVVKDLALDIDEIDIRSGTVAYRVKGKQL